MKRQTDEDMVDKMDLRDKQFMTMIQIIKEECEPAQLNRILIRMRAETPKMTSTSQPKKRLKIKALLK